MTKAETICYQTKWFWPAPNIWLLWLLDSSGTWVSAIMSNWTWILLNITNNHRCWATSLGSFGTFSSCPTPRCGKPICPGKQPPCFVCILIHSNLSMIAALKLAENFAKRRESFANKKLRQTFLIKLMYFWHACNLPAYSRFYQLQVLKQYL